MLDTVKASKALTVRLPESIYKGANALAQKRNTSLNALIQEGLAKLIQEEEYVRFSESFDLLADDPEQCDIEWAMDAQREVVLRDDD